MVVSSARPSYFARIQVPTREFVAAALAYGRRSGANQRISPAVVDEDELIRRYVALQSEILHLAAGDEKLRAQWLDLEDDTQAVGHSAWVPIALATRADESERAIRLAREVWEGLGIHQHDAALLERPHTYRGFFEGRMWIMTALFSLVMAVIAASESWLGLTWAWIVMLITWLGLLLVLFGLRRSALITTPRAELPRSTSHWPPCGRQDAVRPPRRPSSCVFTSALTTVVPSRGCRSHLLPAVPVTPSSR